MLWTVSGEFWHEGKWHKSDYKSRVEADSRTEAEVKVEELNGEDEFTRYDATTLAPVPGTGVKEKIAS